jgi:hypothetical protein
MPAHQRSEVNQAAPLRWVSREDFDAYFKALPPDERWANTELTKNQTLWHWEERRWWVIEDP